MRNRAVRALLVLLAVAAQAGAGYWIWQLNGQVTATARDAATFESQTQQLAVDLVNLGGTEQAYVADGQDAQAWMRKASDLSSSLTSRLAATRSAARSPEARTALDAATQMLTAFEESDARAREYLETNQRISASDVIFTDGAAQLAKAGASIDEARIAEASARATETAALRQTQLYVLGGAVALTFIVLLLLFPVPRHSSSDEDETQETLPTGGLGLNQVSRSASGTGETGEASIALADLDAPPTRGLRVAPGVAAATASSGLTEVADICATFARVKEPRELPPLLERVGGVLDAAGLIIWMPDGPNGSLRPVLAHGYQPLAITRMGTIAVDADNATALAYRTRAQHMVPPEAGSNAAIVSPLVTAEGCSGVMAVELKPGLDVSNDLRSLAAIVSAQLATLISPAAEGASAGQNV